MHTRTTTSIDATLVRVLAILVALWCAPGAGAAPTEPDSASLTGFVIDRTERTPVEGATIHLLESNRFCETDSTGRFQIDNLPPGQYTIRITRVGFTPIERPITLPHPDSRVRSFALTPAPINLPGITVRPRLEPHARPVQLGSASLSPEQLRQTPQFGEDIFRAAARLPGVTANDLSSRFIVRGGEHDQVLVRLDGMELEKPFHMKDVEGGVVSIVDVSTIREVNLATGGFGAEYGDRLSGVFNLQTRDLAASDPNYGVSISLTNVRANGEGTFSRRRGSWLGSARRGYVDLVTDFDGEFEELKPRYYDAFGKVSYRVSRQHQLSLHLLHAHDNLSFSEDTEDRSQLIHDDSYAWLTLASAWSPILNTSTLLSTGRLDHDRSGEDIDAALAPFRYRVEDRRDYHFVGVKHDAVFSPVPWLQLKGGAEFRSMSVGYDYRKEWLNYTYVNTGSQAYYHSNIDTTSRLLTVTGKRWSTYLSTNIQPFAALSFESGLRYDTYSYTADRILSPRLQLEYDMTPSTTIRLAWGRYAQSQKIYDLAIPDNDHTFYPAERAEHRVIGLLQQLPAQLELRIETYDKRLSDLRPRYNNWMQSIFLFPEASDDRMKVFRAGERSRGLEFYLADRSTRPFTWRISYALAEVTQKVSGYVDDDQWLAVNREIPGDHDQRHALMADVAWQTPGGWSFSAAWQYRTGWPYTEPEIASLGIYNYVAPGALNGRRYEPYSRLDLRVAKTFRIGSGDMRFFVEVMNALDQTTTRVYEYYLDCSEPECQLESVSHAWLGVLPSIGISWRFGN